MGKEPGIIKIPFQPSLRLVSGAPHWPGCVLGTFVGIRAIVGF